MGRNKKDTSEYSDNPFEVKGLTLAFFNTKSKEREVVSSDNRIFVMQEAGKRISYMKDNLEYIKVFQEALPVLMKLSTPATQTLLYIFSILPMKKDEIHIYPPAAMEWMNYKTLKSVYKGINELIQADFIAPKKGSQDLYFINSNYFYNGKRT